MLTYGGIILSDADSYMYMSDCLRCQRQAIESAEIAWGDKY